MAAPGEAAPSRPLPRRPPIPADRQRLELHRRQRRNCRRRQQQRPAATPVPRRRPRPGRSPTPSTKRSTRSTKRLGGTLGQTGVTGVTEGVVERRRRPRIGGRQSRRRNRRSGRRPPRRQTLNRRSTPQPSQCRSDGGARNRRGRLQRDPIEGSAVYPSGSRVNERGHLEVAGCDVVELAAELGTPAYIYAEDDIRARARAYREAFERRGADFEVLFASKSLPCTAAYRLFAEEGLSVDVASGGELHMALRAGFDPDRIHMHGNNKTDEEILFAARSGIRHLILDSFDEIERCERLLEQPQRVLIRVTPGIKPSTHDYITTGQLDSKFGFGLEDGLAARAIERVLASDEAGAGRAARPHRLADLRARALHAGDPRARRAGRRLVQGRQRRRRPRRRLHRRGRAALDRRLRRRQGARRRRGLRRGRADPGRAGPLAGRQRRRHRLPGRHRQGDPRRPHLRRRRRRHVRQPAADALRLPLRGADRRPRRRPSPTPWSRSPACTASPATCSSATRCWPSPRSATSW